MRYSLILPWITVVTALPQLQQEVNLTERDALAESASFYEEDLAVFDRRDAKGGRNRAGLTNAASAASSVAGKAGSRFAHEFGSDILRTLGSDANDLLMQKLRSWEGQPNQGPQPPAQAPQPQAQDPPQAPAPPPQAQAPRSQAQAPPQAPAPQPQAPAPPPQRRDPNWETALYKAAGHLFKEYSPDVSKSIMKTTADNINQRQQQQQQQQQPHRRDPRFFKSLGDDLKKFAQGAEHVVEAVAPVALKYGPEIAMGLMARDFELSARDLKVLEARDPSFWKTVGNDFKKVAQGAEKVAQTLGPTALKYAPEIAGAVLMARDLDALEARYAMIRQAPDTDPPYGRKASMPWPAYASTSSKSQAARDFGALEARDPFLNGPGPQARMKKFEAPNPLNVDPKAPAQRGHAWKLPPPMPLPRGLKALQARDPNFWKTVKDDAEKGAKGAANLARTYGPDVALALLGHQSEGKKARDLHGEGLYKRDADAEAEFGEVYERDAGAEVGFGEL